MSLLANIFVVSMWSQLDRPARWLEDMLPVNQFPTVDVFIVTYNGVCGHQAVPVRLQCKLVPPLEVSTGMGCAASDILSSRFAALHLRSNSCDLNLCVLNVQGCHLNVLPISLPGLLHAEDTCCAMLCRVSCRACGCGAADLHSCLEPELPWQPPAGACVG